MATSVGRRSKIVATIGPSSNDAGTLREMMRAGMNVARLNFSHGTHEYHRQTYETIRATADELGLAIGIMMDLQGPKIRTGLLKDGSVTIVAGDAICITTRGVPGDAETISTTYKGLPQDVHEGDIVYISDGLLELEVNRVEGQDIHCTIVHGGYLGEHKGINLPGVSVSAASLTEKDLEDLAFGLGLGVDFVAISFVRNEKDITDLRARIKAANKNAAIVAKIERPEAVKRFDAILAETDAVMLARGDLGVEVPLDDVPQIQKSIIKRCNDFGTPVITATQMLESMVQSPRPTRAEANDVANAVYDGTDAVMLSAETASGDHPVNAVRIMARIAENADCAIARNPTHDQIVRMRESGIRKGESAFGDAIAQSASRTSSAVGAKCIACFSKLGFTAARIARFRPNVPIVAITLSDAARNRCSVIWGVEALHAIEPCSTDELDRIIDEELLNRGIAQHGDTVVIAAGIPLAMRTRTNMLKLHRIGMPG